jgi:hypothetical protein
MWGGTPTPHGRCSYCRNPYHHVRNCPSTRQFPNYSYGHMNTSFSRLGDDDYFDSYNPTWGQQSNISWQAQDPGIHAPQFHELQHQSYQQFYDHAFMHVPLNQPHNSNIRLNHLLLNSLKRR